MHVSVCACESVCMYVCVSVCACECMCVCARVHMGEREWEREGGFILLIMPHILWGAVCVTETWHANKECLNGTSGYRD